MGQDIQTPMENEGSAASIHIPEGQHVQASSYGYKPFKIPNTAAEQEPQCPPTPGFSSNKVEQHRPPIEQDIDPIGAAQDVLQQLNAIEANRNQRGGEMIIVGDT